jgi:hypothetical protein
MTNEKLETRVTQLERLVMWLITTVGGLIIVGAGVLAGAFVQGDLHLPDWDWPAIAAALSTIMVTSALLQRKMMQLDD